MRNVHVAQFILEDKKTVNSLPAMHCMTEDTFTLHHHILNNVHSTVLPSIRPHLHKHTIETHTTKLCVQSST